MHSLHRVTPHVELWHAPEGITVLGSTHYVTKIEVHPGIDVYQVTIVCLAVFELNQLWRLGSGVEQ